jgi:hypothetical protein
MSFIEKGFKGISDILVPDSVSLSGNLTKTIPKGQRIEHAVFKYASMVNIVINCQKTFIEFKDKFPNFGDCPRLMVIHLYTDDVEQLRNLELTPEDKKAFYGYETQHIVFRHLLTATTVLAHVKPLFNLIAQIKALKKSGSASHSSEIMFRP